MSGEDVIKEIDSLETVEREKVLAYVMKRYIKDAFIACSNYDFWLNDADEIYSELNGDLEYGAAPSTEEESPNKQ